MPDIGTPLTGGRVNYYLVQVNNPQRENVPAYQAECEDIIEALELNFDEANIFKELWRTANARRQNGKPGHSALYGAEKIVHYAGRILRRVRRQHNDDVLTKTVAGILGGGNPNPNPGNPTAAAISGNGAAADPAALSDPGDQPRSGGSAHFRGCVASFLGNRS